MAHGDAKAKGDIEPARAIVNLDGEARFHVPITVMKASGERWNELLPRERIIVTMSISEAGVEAAQYVREQGWTLYTWDVSANTEEKAKKLKPDYIEFSNGEIPNG